MTIAGAIPTAPKSNCWDFKSLSIPDIASSMSTFDFWIWINRERRREPLMREETGDCREKVVNESVSFKWHERDVAIEPEQFSKEKNSPSFLLRKPSLRNLDLLPWPSSSILRLHFHWHSIHFFRLRNRSPFSVKIPNRSLDFPYWQSSLLRPFQFWRSESDSVQVHTANWWRIQKWFPLLNLETLEPNPS